MRDLDKYIRQHAIIDQRARDARVVVAGLGMLGSWVTHALARMVNEVIVFDGADKVEAINLGCQAYGEGHVGQGKAAAIAGQLFGFMLTPYARKFPEGIRKLAHPPDVVVSCVDTIEGRHRIATWCEASGVPLFIDTRALAEMATIATVQRPEDFQWYHAQLPREEDTIRAPCGGEGTAFVGMWVASRVAANINNWARGMQIPRLFVYHVGLGQQIGGEE